MGAAGWGGYQNGEIPLSAMVATEEGQYLHPNAHKAWGEMVRACAAATGVWMGCNEGYRNLDKQWYYWNLYQSGEGNVAAYPGSSNHGRGVAVDIENYDAAFGWLIANAQNYNWSWATGQASGERWHWEYVGSLTQTAGDTGTPIENGEDMAEIDREVIRREARARLYKNVETGQYAALDIESGYFRRNGDATWTTAELNSQLPRWEDPYKIIGNGEAAKVTRLTAGEWANIIGEVNLYRKEVGFAKLVSDWTPSAAELARKG